MRTIEQAYQTLGLKPGASFKEVVEVHEDLLALWHPDRLSDNPRLRSKGAGKVEEINSAYDQVMAHLGQTGPLKPSNTFQPVSKKAPSGKGGKPKESDSPQKAAASLFDEVFSETASQAKRQIPVWPIVLAIIVLGPLISYWIQSSQEESPVPVSAHPVQEPVTEKDSLDKETDNLSTQTQSESELAQSESTPPPSLRQVSQSVIPPEKPPVETRSPAHSRPRLARSAATTPSSSQEVRTIVKSPSTQAVLTPPQSKEPEDVPGPVLIRSDGVTDESVKPLETSPQDLERQLEIAETAYQNLMANSRVAGQLVDGEFSPLRFSEWKIVQQTVAEVWIDLIATEPTGAGVHFIWSVNIDNGSTRPLSQAARNLEFQAHRQ